MRDDQREILEHVAVHGRVHPDTFKGRGMIVSGLVRQGYLEWERGLSPKSQRATALLVTEFGKAAITALGQSTRNP